MFWADSLLAICRRIRNLSGTFDMRQFLTIAANAFMELIRQPVFLLLMTGSVLFEIFLAVPYYFAFGDEPKLVENSALAVMLLSGLLGAVLSASSSLARESAPARRWRCCPSRSGAPNFCWRNSPDWRRR